MNTATNKNTVFQFLNYSSNFSQQCIHDCYSMCAIGVFHYRAERFEAVASLFEKAAKKGNAGAMRSLAGCYVAGVGADKDKHREFQLLSSAAKANDVDAEVYVASYFREGIGTNKNEKTLLLSCSDYLRAEKQWFQ